METPNTIPAAIPFAHSARTQDDTRRVTSHPHLEPTARGLGALPDSQAPLTIRAARTPDTVELSGSRPLGVQRLVAGHVAQRIEFNAPAEKTPPANDAYPMYRRPADKNAAATGVVAGRQLDVQG